MHPLTLFPTSLARNGYALVASTAVTSVLGLLFWVLTARLYTSEQVGIGAALISTLLTLGNIAQLNLGNVLNRFVPVAGARAGKFIIATYAAAVVAALVAAACSLPLIGNLVPPLAFLASDKKISIWFALAVAAWTVFALQDSVLAGLRKSVWVPIENAAYAISKIILLVMLANTGLAAWGPFAAWSFPLLAAIGLVSALIFYRLLPKERFDASRPESGVSIREIFQFFRWDYVGTLAMMTALAFGPLLVLKVAGPSANANYYLAGTISYSLYLIGRSMGISLLVEGAADRGRLRSLAADSLVHTMILLVAAAGVVIACAPLIMGLFGPTYAAEGTSLLRILALASLPWALITIYLAVARVEGQMKTIAVTQIATMVLVLSVGSFLVPRMGALGMGLAWLAAHTIVGLAILVSAIARFGNGVLIDWSLAFGTSCAHLFHGLPQRKDTAGTNPTRLALLERLLQEIDEPAATSWEILRAIPSQSDSVSAYLGVRRGESCSSAHDGPPAGACAVLKTATGPEGIQSLERNRARIETLRSDPRLINPPFELPQILAFTRSSNSVFLVERIISGEDGRITLKRSGREALQAAAQSITFIHERTAKQEVINGTWLKDWIDRPCSLLETPVHTIMTRTTRRAAIALFREEQHQFWSGRPVSLGWCHGDFSPGNIIFTRRTKEETAPSDSVPQIIVSGIVDWDRAEPNAPPGFDACHLAIAVRSIMSGRELGEIIRELLLAPRWSPQERIWLAAHRERDSRLWIEGEGVRVLVGLVWLGRVTANLEKSGRFARNRLWSSVNVERVLQAFFEGRSKTKR
jgi:O-antigen/teichoic acid export membrane protein